MATLVPRNEGKTAANTDAFAYVDHASGTIGFQMETSRRNRPTDGGDETDRIRAILFANESGDFFYSTWRNFRRRWRSRMSRGMNKGAREFVSGE